MIRELEITQPTQYEGDSCYTAPARDQFGIRCKVIWKLPYEENMKEAVDQTIDWSKPYAVEDEVGNDITSNAVIVKGLSDVY